MGRDRFGTKRGKCGFCEKCYEYTPPADGTTLACDYNNHTMCIDIQIYSCIHGIIHIHKRLMARQEYDILVCGHSNHRREWYHQQVACIRSIFRKNRIFLFWYRTYLYPFASWIIDKSETLSKKEFLIPKVII